MADAYPFTPIIRLPSTRRADKTKDEPAAGHRTNEILRYLVSDTLFVDELPTSVRESDVRALLQHCMPIEMKIHDADGYLRFSHAEFADRAYTVYNGFTFANGARLRLRMCSDASLEPEACGDLLQIKNVPLYMDDNSLFDLFRPFGPLNLCKSILEGSQFRGMVYVQFFAQSDSDIARKQLHSQVIEGSVLAITSFVQPASDDPQVAPSSKINSSFVDYANLYVKNLDPSLSNDDLFSLFRKFGRIVSARVMSNPDNGLSKGYGFVSYAKPEEATAALCEMNNKLVHNKPLLVAYHEPKKSRSDRTRQTSTPVPERHPSGQPDLGGQAMNAHRRFRGNGSMETSPIHGLGIEAIEPMTISPKMYLPQRKPSSSALDASLKLTPPYSSSPNSGTSAGMSLVSLASGISVQPPPQCQTPTPARPAKPSLRRRGSLESVSTVMTEMTSNMQRQRMEDAVHQTGDYGSLTQDLVDMLLTLKRKERSLCLFNKDFLKEKIQLALEALETFDGSGSEDEDGTGEAKTNSFMGTTNQPISPPSSSTVRMSKAIPIVPPPEEEAKPAVNSNQERVEKLLASMKGQPVHEQKQLLGDCLFPLVKAVGTKQAPRVTIELLDTLDLAQLAHEMHDKDALKERVRVAFADIKTKSFSVM